MKSFIDSYGLYHDKPVNAYLKPSSNNGFIYTSYAKALGLKTESYTHYGHLFTDCIGNDIDFYINRLPGKTRPPISKDEFIGMIILAPHLSYDLFKQHNFNLSRHSKITFKSIKSILKLAYLSLFGNEIEKHRNYFWEYQLKNAYPIAFKIPSSIVYFANKYNGQDTSLVQKLSFLLGSVSTILLGQAGVKNMLWVQLKFLDSKFLIRFIDQKKNFLEYFGEDHIFNEKQNQQL